MKQSEKDYITMKAQYQCLPILLKYLYERKMRGDKGATETLRKWDKARSERISEMIIEKNKSVT